MWHQPTHRGRRLLHERINSLPHLAVPIQITMLDLHPHADGTLRGPHATTHQLDALLATTGLLTPRE